MSDFKKYITFFVIGSYGYGLIELLWRGHTHWSMLIAGGICFMTFSYIAQVLKEMPLLLKALIGAIIITSVELAFGIVFNIVLKMGIWDYSLLPFNFLGQICPHFSLAWVGLSLLLIPLADKLNDLLS